MRAEIADPSRTLEYSRSHDQVAKAFPFVLVGILLGLFMLTPLQSAAPTTREVALGTLTIVICLAFLAGLLYRRTQPDVPSIVLMPEGIRFRDISERVIPWNEIRKVGIAKVSQGRDLFSNRVTSLEVSPAFHSALTGDRWLSSTVSERGNPSFVYIGYFHTLPFDEFHHAVQLRWHAFSRHARNVPLPPGLLQSAGGRDEAQVPAAPTHIRSRTVESAGRFEGIALLVAIFKGASVAGRVTGALALVGIVAISANHLGLWSTASQVKARTQAAELKAWRKRIEAEDKAREEERRRFDERMKRAFRCMDQGYYRTKDCQ